MPGHKPGAARLLDEEIGRPAEEVWAEHVFGCVDKWARAFAGIDTAAQTAAWYSGTTPFNALQLSSSLEGFSSDLGSAIAATAGSLGVTTHAGMNGSVKIAICRIASAVT